MIKLSLFLILGIVSSLVLFSNNMIYGQQQENITSNEPINFIAIQHAQSGSISKVNATTNFLELHDVSNPILFSDRPDRIVKTESTQQFLDKWYDAGTDTKNNSFFLDPPNAALIIDDQQRQDVAILELFEPSYDYDSNILVYNFNYLNNTNTKLPNEFGETTLVIDASHPIHIH